MSAIVGTPPCASITPGRGLDPFFSPRTVALIGATESPGSVGRTLMENLLAFEGQIFPVNPRRATVLGRSAYPNVAAIAEPLDLAAVATPAATVPDVIRDCAGAQVRAAAGWPGRAHAISGPSRRPPRRTSARALSSRWHCR
jgi:hypothetical protein